MTRYTLLQSGGECTRMASLSTRTRHGSSSDHQKGQIVSVMPFPPIIQITSGADPGKLPTPNVTHITGGPNGTHVPNPTILFNNSKGDQPDAPTQRGRPERKDNRPSKSAEPERSNRSRSAARGGVPDADLAEAQKLRQAELDGTPLAAEADENC
jgi:hypothetical protein